MKGRGIFLVFLIVLSGLYYWIFIGNTEYPRPTEEYYVNDFADVLMQATVEEITLQCDYLYNLTEDLTDGGTQIVFATFEVETLSEIAEYDKTNIYREWKIGKDDMGLLILMFFMPSSDETELELVETQVEIGYRMEQYMVPSRIAQIVEDTLYNQQWDYLIDLGVASLMYELIDVVRTEIYDLGLNPYYLDMDDYWDYLMDYVPETSYEPSEMTTLSYLLSPYSTYWDKIFALLPVAFFMLYGGGVGILKAGGGSSGGHGIFRRRR